MSDPIRIHSGPAAQAHSQPFRPGLALLGLLSLATYITAPLGALLGLSLLCYLAWGYTCFLVSIPIALALYCAWLSYGQDRNRPCFRRTVLFGLAPNLYYWSDWPRSHRVTRLTYAGHDYRKLIGPLWREIR